MKLCIGAIYKRISSTPKGSYRADSFKSREVIQSELERGQFGLCINFLVYENSVIVSTTLIVCYHLYFILSHNSVSGISNFVLPKNYNSPWFHVQCNLFFWNCKHFRKLIVVMHGRQVHIFLCIFVGFSFWRWQITVYVSFIIIFLSFMHVTMFICEKQIEEFQWQTKVSFAEFCYGQQSPLLDTYGN